MKLFLLKLTDKLHGQVAGVLVNARNERNARFLASEHVWNKTTQVRGDAEKITCELISYQSEVGGEGVLLRGKILF